MKYIAAILIAAITLIAIGTSAMNASNVKTELGSVLNVPAESIVITDEFHTNNASRYYVEWNGCKNVFVKEDGKWFEGTRRNCNN